ncbi:MAG TPA: hypothetical protein DEB73_00735 [Candidatus Magasanikbacteria bacterium]|uniref:Uncharacterized protein n=1 Tax=Candidatus Magasanikbacteria bacterium GW2011_GWC2_41_17 TaxID=1619048 RepID=A0A0G0V7V3_9BACT|nr:MAG: hypothetical protein UU49_C0035G0007 [Candidatus Magasanikbacteria bacterium GW2011_GWC2_41_17]HBV57784.1 hypothetical protein [Candidatus Magasanikbacteria bacterium]
MKKFGRFFGTNNETARGGEQRTNGRAKKEGVGGGNFLPVRLCHDSFVIAILKIGGLSFGERRFFVPAKLARQLHTNHVSFSQWR